MSGPPLASRPRTGRLARFVPLAGAVLLVGRLVACTSTSGGKAGHTSSVTTGGGGSSITGGGGATTGGPNCGGHVCQVGAAYGKGNTFMVPIVPCDPSTYTCAAGPTTIQATVCPPGNVCNAAAGGCLAPLPPPPAQACTVATDCMLPPSTCLETAYLVTYSDPSCDTGQCRWKMNVDQCGHGQPCSNGGCGTPRHGMTAGPSAASCPAFPPPPSAPDQACASTADGKPPAPACFAESVVTFVNPACDNGACVWDSSFTPCLVACSDGARAGAQCATDADCSPWAATCTNDCSGDPAYWSVKSCPAPACSAGTCQRDSPIMTACGFGDGSCAGGMCVDGGVGGGGTGGSGQ